MAQRSPNHQKYHSGCMWRLSSFFDFHQGHPNRKLLSDWRHVNRRAVETGYLRSRPNLLTNFDARCQGIDDGVDNKTVTVDIGKTSVNNLMEEEMSTEKYPKKQMTTAKNHKKPSKTCQRACQIPIHGWKDAASVRNQQYSHPNSEEKSLSKLDPAAIMEAFCNQIHCNNERDCCDILQKSISVLKHDQLNEINLPLVQMSEAAEASINQKFIDAKCLSRDGASHQSKQFLDALEIINSNKELFLKLLQDPNSLLVKHIQDFQDSQAEKDPTKSFSETKLSDYEITNGRQCEEHVCNQKQNTYRLFRKKIKFQDTYQSKKGSDPQPSTRMVVLKPGSASMQNFETNTSYSSSLQSCDSLRGKGHSFKPTYFSFGNIKRKLKHAIGESRKEQHWISMIGTLHKFSYDHPGSKDGGKGIGVDIVGRNLPSKIYSNIDRTARSPIDVKRSNKICKPKDFEESISHEFASANESDRKNLNLATVRYSKQRESSINVEARRHLSKMLSNGVKDEFFSRNQVPITLGRILSLNEYDFSPAYSPGREGGEHGFGTAQMRSSPCSDVYMADENSLRLQEEKKTSHLSLLKLNVEAPPCAENKKLDDELQVFDSKPIILENHFSDTSVHENISPIRDDSSPKGYVKIVETSVIIHPGKINFLGVSSETDDAPTTSANQSTATTKICEENGFLECSRLGSLLENQPPTSSLVLSSSSPLSIQKVIDLDRIKDKAEQPSPVSVLEPFFGDEVTSPASTITQPAKPQIQPLNFEENCSSDLTISPSDPKINFSTCMEDEVSTSEYVRAVLQASGLNWDELLVKRHLSDQLLDPSSFEKMELLPFQFWGEPQLFFDCISEVLLDVYQCYFGWSPWVSFIKPRIGPVPVEKIVVHEVMNNFDRHLYLQQPPQYTLEQLIVKDMKKSGTWMDIRIDTEDIAIEMVEASLEELIMETIVELRS